MIYALLTEGMDKAQHRDFDRRLEGPSEARHARDVLNRFGVREQAPDGLVVDFG